MRPLPTTARKGCGPTPTAPSSARKNGRDASNRAARHGVVIPGSGMTVRALLDRLYLFAGFAAGGFMILIFVLMMVLSAGRPLGINLPAGDDLVAWCMAAMSFLGLAHTFRSGEMIRVGLLIDRLTGRPRYWVEVTALVIGCGFVAFFAWYAVLMTFDS